MIRRFRITVEGKSYEVEVEPIGESDSLLRADTPQISPRPTPMPQPSRARGSSSTAGAAAVATAPPRPVVAREIIPAGGATGTVKAPMPCSIISVKCKAGDKINKGDIMLAIEAMKMEQDIYAPISGLVKEVRVEAGSKVKHGEILVIIEP